MPATPPPLLARIAAQPERTAIESSLGAFTFAQLHARAAQIAGALLHTQRDLQEARVAFWIPPGFDFTATLLGIWAAGGSAVPLAISHPPAELEHVIHDAAASIVIAPADQRARLEPLAHAHGAAFRAIDELAQPAAASLPDVPAQRRALMMYTSGTTGKPKGVVHTHASIRAQIESLVQAWEWSADDRILLVLPLHHVHGLINVLCCALWSGATCTVEERFDAEVTWDHLAAGDLTLFMAVPTIYHRLIASWDAAPPNVQQQRCAGAHQLRLMVSGSAALPVQTLERWREITGHTLLERYGMTEIGMGLSNPLHGPRRPGFVGTPLPGVQARIVNEQGSEVAPGTAGELEVRGPGVFLEYWHNPEATRAAFRGDWFRTGDVAVLEDGAYRLLGRSSIDIIKSGGYKISALEIEETLRTHGAIAECAVVGVPDFAWGERVCAAVETRPDQTLTLDQLQQWARERLAPYKIPRSLLCVPTLPRNAMGKVLKPDVRALFE